MGGGKILTTPTATTTDTQKQIKAVQPIKAFDSGGLLFSTLGTLSIIALVLLVGLLLYLIYICCKYKYNRSRLNSDSSRRNLDRIRTRSQGCQTPPPIPKPPEPKLLPLSLSPSTGFNSTKAVVNETAIRDCNNQFRPIDSPKMISFKNQIDGKSSPPISPRSEPPPLGRSFGRSRGQKRGLPGSEDNPIMFRQRVAGHGRMPLSQ